MTTSFSQQLDLFFRIDPQLFHQCGLERQRSFKGADRFRFFVQRLPALTESVMNVGSRIDLQCLVEKRNRFRRLAAFLQCACDAIGPALLSGKRLSITLNASALSGSVASFAFAARSACSYFRCLINAL